MNLSLKISAVVATVLFLMSLFWIVPQYNLWRAGINAKTVVIQATAKGKAALEESKNSRQVMIQAAKAEQESAAHKAEAIRIMGQAAKEFPEYRKQEFMTAFGEALREGTISQVMYVPTETMIPIMEAGRTLSPEVVQ